MSSAYLQNSHRFFWGLLPYHLVLAPTGTWVSKPKVGFGVISININRMILTKSDLNSFGNCLSQIVICKIFFKFYVPENIASDFSIKMD
jgi:hypothetical protein